MKFASDHEPLITISPRSLYVMVAATLRRWTIERGRLIVEYYCLFVLIGI